MNTGKIVQVIGPVVDVQFAENTIPPIYQALTVEFSAAGAKQLLTLEIQQHLGAGVARAIAIDRATARVLGVTPGAPVLQLRRIALSFGDKPVEYRVSTVHRPFSGAVHFHQAVFPA